MIGVSPTILAEADPGVTAAQARTLRRRLAQAGDEQVLQVLRLVDNLAERGEADALLDPIRHRLRVLRPARPMRLARLLFMPLDRLIVSPREWRSGTALVPRSALTPLTEVIRAGLGLAAEALEPVIAATSGADSFAIARIGAAVWPRAAAALEAASRPPAWTEQGLPAAEFPPLQVAIAFLLAHEARLVDLEAPGIETDLLDRELAALLDGAHQRSARCWGMLLAILLQRFAGSAVPFRAATARHLDRRQAAVAEAALALAAGWVEAAASARGASGLGDMADEIARQAELLDRLAADAPRRRQATELRAALRAGCAARFEAGLEECIGARLSAPLDRAGIEAMERDARDLRRLEMEARRFGPTAAYDDRLDEMVARVLGAEGVDRADRIRLVEILAGAPAALRAYRTIAAE